MESLVGVQYITYQLCELGSYFFSKSHIPHLEKGDAIGTTLGIAVRIK